MCMIVLKCCLVLRSVCSTTIWVGHLPKNASQGQIADAFVEFGTVKSVDVSKLTILIFLPLPPPPPQKKKGMLILIKKYRRSNHVFLLSAHPPSLSHQGGASKRMCLCCYATKERSCKSFELTQRFEIEWDCLQGMFYSCACINSSSVLK